MQLKEKIRRALTAVAVLFILLGLALQGAMIVQRLRWDRARGETAAAILEVYARHYAGQLEAARSEDLDSDTAWLAGEPARRRTLRDGEQPELLLLVNPWNAIPEGYAPQSLVEVGYFEA